MNHAALPFATSQSHRHAGRVKKGKQNKETKNSGSTRVRALYMTYTIMHLETTPSHLLLSSDVSERSVQCSPV